MTKANTLPLRDKDVLSVEEAAQFLTISKTTLYTLLNSGALKSARLGGRRLIRRVDVDALLTNAARSA